MIPLIAAICPTYKRPEMLRTLVRCFEWQNYPQDRRILIVLDDAGLYGEARVEGVTGVFVHSQRDRFDTIPEKYNRLLELVDVSSPDLVIVMEDDDLYLPNHFRVYGDAWASGAKFIAPDSFWTTHGCQHGIASVDNSGRGRMHGGWGFDNKLIQRVRYPSTAELSFDQQLWSRLRFEISGLPTSPAELTYVYRWQNGPWNGSQAGEEGFSQLMASLRDKPCREQWKLYPALDGHAFQLCKFLEGNGVSFPVGSIV